MKASHKNFQVIVKNVRTFDGKNAADFIEWYEKICISPDIYDKAALRVLQGALVPSAATDTDGSKLVPWNTANKDLYNVLFFTTKGATCSVVRRFAGKTLDEDSGHGQRAWAALRGNIDGCWREVLIVEHVKMNSARMSPGQDPDEFLYELDTRHKRLNACNPPEGPTDCQFEDIILQALPPERIHTSQLEKPDFEIADICRMMYAIYAANLARSSSMTGIAGGRGCRAHGRRQSQRHRLPLLRTRGPHVPSLRQHEQQRQQQEQWNEQQNHQQGGRRQRGRQRCGKTSRQLPSNGRR